MKKIDTQSTSRRSAECTPITLREGEQVRLVFAPSLVDNTANPVASVDGYFVYQRKTASQRWVPVRTISLSTLKSGEAFKLQLHAQELWTLLDGVVALYHLHRDQGIPKGRKTFVEMDQTLAGILAAGEDDLTRILASQPDNAAAVLLKLVKWLATSLDRKDAAAKVSSIALEQMPSITALLGLAAIKEAFTHWKENQTNGSEQFWQQSLSARTYVLSQVFAYPVVLIAEKAYVGGKQIKNKGGKEVDFLLATESTSSVILIEIKTPQTKLLGSECRQGVYPLSQDLIRAIAQALSYRQSLMRRFDTLSNESAESSGRLTLGEPRCIVVAGHSKDLQTGPMRENFELQRERIQGVTIITYDELFRRLELLIELLESGE